MKRLILVALFVAFFSQAAEAKNVLILRGLFGEALAPMTDVADALRKQGHKVTLGSHRAPPAGNFDYVIGHSRGADVAMIAYPKAKKITLDPTWLNAGCPGCPNLYNPTNKLPFLLCCGGYQARGARNEVVRAGHTYLPTASLKRIVSLVK